VATATTKTPLIMQLLLLLVVVVVIITVTNNRNDFMEINRVMWITVYAR
jgi:hypothetical protein